MRKTYMMLLVLLFTALGVTSVNAAKIQKIALEKEMFKAWTSNEPGAEVDAEPAPEPKNQGEFGCAFALYETIGTGATVYGHANVYFKWYADLTGTKKMYITGTPGIKPRLMFNRAAIEATAADPDGGTYIEIAEKIPESGVLEIDLENHSQLKTDGYLHLNAIKTPWSDTATGTITKIEIEGTVKPLTGWVEVINNGDVEDSDDLGSFPVSRNGGTSADTGGASFLPEIVTDADTENYNKVLKVVADNRAAVEEGGNGSTQTWSCQFYIKFNEMLPEGTKYKLEMDVKSSAAASVSNSAQGEPRKWHAGFVDAFQTSEEWIHKSWEGTVTADQGKDGGFGSIAFDLNNATEPIEFYFDNISFCKYVPGSNVVDEFSAEYGYNNICLNLTDKTNIKDLVKANGGERVVLPNNCVSVKWNGTDITDMMSVEGRADGKLYAFINAFNEAYEGIDFMAEDAEVEVSFAGDEQLKFVSGLLTDQAVPSFNGLKCTYNSNVGELMSYRAIPPKVLSTVPEEGSFNLPLTMTEFKVKFDALANAESLKAQLGSEDLTVSPAEGYAKEFTLTRTGDGELTKGQKVLKITGIEPEFEATGELGEASVTLNFGPVEADPNDVPFDVIPASYFQNCAGGQIPEGFVHYADGMEKRVPGNGYGSGGRMMVASNGVGGPDFDKGMYLRTNYLVYGEIEDHPLTLEEGKKYDISFNLAGWEGSTSYVNLQIVDAEENVYFSEVLKTQGQAKETPQNSFAYKNSFIAEATGNYLMKWVLCNAEGAATGETWAAQFLANVKMSYIPNTVGAVETALLNEALEKATGVRDNNTAERYAGPAFTALNKAITKYTEEKEGYTGPSQFTDAATDLDALRLAMVDHRTACDDYDKAIKATIDVVRQVTAEEDNGKPNEKKKFEATDEFAQVKAAADKYHGTSEWRNLADPEDPEAEPNWQLFYEFDVLTDDAVLTAAIAELTGINNFANGMFTLGASSTGKTGYAVLHERLRLGVELLKSLGVAENADEIVRANAVLGDDDEVAASIMHRAEVVILADLAKGEESVLFKGVESDPDPESGNVTVTYPSYDMSVFVKNPNLYVTKADRMDVTSAPGWTITKKGGYEVAWSTGWGAFAATNDVPADATLTNWSQGYTATQTIENLPAGVYTLKAGLMERNGDVSLATLANSTLFARTAANYEEGNAEKPGLFKAIDVNGQQQFGWTDNMVLEGIEVVDGTVTIGVDTDGATHLFFNNVQLWMTGKIADHDYAADEATGIAAKKASKVSSIQLFDVNGRRIPAAKKGLVIVKKTMADGTVKVEKIVKK